MEPRPFYRRIEDYAIIGNCRTAALVSREGSLDWLCLPRFDSPSIFARLLDVRRGGFFRISPTRPAALRRQYLDETNVLQTTFTTADGEVRLTDFMPVASEASKARRPWPDHQVLRLLEGVRGEVEIEVVCEPRPDYARGAATARDRGKLGISFRHQALEIILQSDAPLRLQADGSRALGRMRLRAGEVKVVSLTAAHAEPAVLLPNATAADLLEESSRWWRHWAGQCRYRGEYRKAVVRSALALKLLTFAPSGAVIAALTTSLPEAVGGERNWDYRYCWLRDASWTLRALFDLGYFAEAEAFLKWLLHTTRLTLPKLQTVYDVYGEARLPLAELSHLAGYRDSRPVRSGNSAWRQFQLDIYGELIAAAHAFVQRGGRLDPGELRLLAGLGETICRCWDRPDQGIWEMPGGARHFTYSKVMSWVGLNRLLDLSRDYPLKMPAGRLEKVRDQIRSAIEEEGWQPGLQSYAGILGSEEMDAALLQLPLVHYSDPEDERMRHTCDQLWRVLGREGLLLRYLPAYDRLPSTEGAFGICNFWEVKYLALRGEREKARRRFEFLLSLGSDLGLYAEEIDPLSKAMLGNFPQAFTHVGLINAALSLEGGR